LGVRQRERWHRQNTKKEKQRGGRNFLIEKLGRKGGGGKKKV